VAVTSVTPRHSASLRWAGIAGLAIGLHGAVCTGAVLPDERADAMYHYYDGGGVRVTGPALLVRKNMADKISVSGSYYADTVSCASIDVVTTASPFKEKRTEYGAGVDYLYNDSLMSMTVTKSSESDYHADTLSMNIAQDLFGGMTTVNMGYSRGKDTVRDNNDPTLPVSSGGVADPDDDLARQPGLRGDYRRGLFEQSLSIRAYPRRLRAGTISAHP